VQLAVYSYARRHGTIADTRHRLKRETAIGRRLAEINSQLRLDRFHHPIAAIRQAGLAQAHLNTMPPGRLGIQRGIVGQYAGYIGLSDPLRLRDSRDESWIDVSAHIVDSME
jgi:hypothetical protein